MRRDGALRAVASVSCGTMTPETWSSLVMISWSWRDRFGWGKMALSGDGFLVHYCLMSWFVPGCVAMIAWVVCIYVLSTPPNTSENRRDPGSFSLWERWLVSLCILCSLLFDWFFFLYRHFRFSHLTCANTNIFFPLAGSRPPIPYHLQSPSSVLNTPLSRSSPQHHPLTFGYFSPTDSNGLYHCYYHSQHYYSPLRYGTRISQASSKTPCVYRSYSGLLPPLSPNHHQHAAPHRIHTGIKTSFRRIVVRLKLRPSNT